VTSPSSPICGVKAAKKAKAVELWPFQCGA
jgi:hypothetical protein